MDFSFNDLVCSLYVTSVNFFYICKISCYTVDECDMGVEGRKVRISLSGTKK